MNLAAASSPPSPRKDDASTRSLRGRKPLEVNRLYVIDSDNAGQLFVNVLIVLGL
jgi:hypothetical protein